MKFPKFSAAITVNDVNLLVMDNHNQESYDIIIGHDLMKELKILIDFDAEEVTFEDQAIPFHMRDQPVQDTCFANEPESDSDSDRNDDVLPPFIQFWDPDSSDNESDDDLEPEEEDNNFFPNEATATKTARTPAVANQFSSSQKLKGADYNMERSSVKTAMNQEYLVEEQCQQLADVLKEFDAKCLRTFSWSTCGSTVEVKLSQTRLPQGLSCCK